MGTDIVNGMLIGLMLAMAICFALWLAGNLILLMVVYIVQKWQERGGGEKMRIRNRWRKKLGIYKLKNLK